jgi:hypothetical protein
LSFGETPTLTVERVTATADSLLGPTGGFTDSECISANSTPDSGGVAFIDEFLCDNVVDGITISGFDEVEVLVSDIDVVDLAIGVTNGTDVIVEGNTIQASRAVDVRGVRASATVAGNDITQVAQPSAASSQTVFVEQRTDGVVVDARSVILDNVVTLQGSGAVGIVVAFAAASGDIVVDGNLITGNGGAQQVGIRQNATSSLVTTAGRLVVSNNVVVGTGLHAIQAVQADTLTALTIVHNSMASSSIDSASEAVVTLATRGAVAGPVAFKNNLLIGGGAAGRGLSSTSTLALVADHNLFHLLTPYRLSNGTTPEPGANDIVGIDPVVQDAATLTVGPTSVAVNAGSDDSDTPATAFGGSARRQGGGPDIGAHER